MNVLSEITLQHCTSCQMCAAVCPSNAIAILLNEDGFYRPYIDNEKCIDCSLCVKVCYKYDLDIKLTTSSKLNKYALYSAWSKDKYVLDHTTSGGIAEILAKQFIRDGYKVIGVVYDTKSNRAKHVIADNLTLTDSFRGSKYIQSYSVDAFRTLVRKVRNEKYAVFGLPCQIYAISRYLELIGIRDNAVLIDLYCHGCPSMLLWEKLSSEIFKKEGITSFRNVLWRSKIYGWGNFVITASDGRHEIFRSSPLHDEFYNLFFSNQVLNDSCGKCKLRGTLEYSDLRLGDFWGRKYRANINGVSGVSIMSDQGERVFQYVINNLEVHKESYTEFLSFQSWKIQYSIDDNIRARLLADLHNESISLREIVGKISKTNAFVTRSKVLIKELLCHMPKCIISLCKRIC